MKKYFNKSLLALFSLFLFAACKKNDTKITYDSSGVSPVLSANVADNDTIPLLPADSLNTALQLAWTNPDYKFSNGISSLNVNYTIQIDTVGSNFTSTNIVQISIASSALNTSLTVADLNSRLGNILLLQTGVPHKIAVRVESFLNQASLPLYSNIFTYIVTPYAPPPKITPPIENTLFIVGDATPGGWPPLSNNESVEQFTMVSATDYQITIPLNASDAYGYKFVAIPGQWTEQWSTSIKHDPNEKNGGPFILNGNDCGTPSASGTYDIDVNFQTGIFTVKPH